MPRPYKPSVITALSPGTQREIVGCWGTPGWLVAPCFVSCFGSSSVHDTRSMRVTPIIYVTSPPEEEEGELGERRPSISQCPVGSPRPWLPALCEGPLQWSLDGQAQMQWLSDRSRGWLKWMRAALCSLVYLGGSIVMLIRLITDLVVN